MPTKNKIVIGGLLLFLAFYTLSTLGCGSSGSGGGSGGNGDHTQGLPPLPADIRITLEALFAEYGSSVPKTVILDALNNIQPSAVGPAQNHIEYIPSPNGLTLEGSSASILDRVSVPDAIVDNDYKVRLYFVDGHSPRKLAELVDARCQDSITTSDIYALYTGYYFRSNMGLGAAVSVAEDGESFTYDTNFRILNFPEPFTAADPSIVKDNNSYKLYFFMVVEDEVPDGGDVPEAEHHMLGVATSEDGSSFTYVGTAYACSKDTTLADPEVFNFNGTYRAFFMANSGVRMVQSSDGGLTFNTPEETILSGYDITNVRFADVKINDAYYMYFGDGDNNLAAAYSTDGSTFTYDTQNPRDVDGQLIGGRGAMPAVQLYDGSFKFYHH